MGRVQRSVFRHRGDGRSDPLLLAPVAEPDENLPHSAHHHWSGDGHRHLPLRSHLQLLVNAFDLKQKDDSYAVSLSGVPFNDAYRYVDWLLTVPLLLIELILVM